MVLPAGTALPPLPHLLLLAAGVAVVGGLLWRARPAFTEPVVLAFAPWMVAGAALHVLFQVGAVPAGIAPLLGTPAVYVSTAILAGAVWLLARRSSGAPARGLGAVGVGVMVAAVASTLAVGGVVRLAVPAAALVGGAALGVGTWVALGRLRPEATAATGRAGLLVLLAHALDGVATAAGVDLLGFGERTPASRLIMEAAGALPTAELVGVGWLFVVVKLLVAGAVVALFADFVREEPSQGYGLLGLVAAVGLGPGAHNLLLFAVASP